MQIIGAIKTRDVENAVFGGLQLIFHFNCVDQFAFIIVVNLNIIVLFRKWPVQVLGRLIVIAC